MGVNIYIADPPLAIPEYSSSADRTHRHTHNLHDMEIYIIQIYSGTTRGRVLNGELYAITICSNDWREIFMKQSVSKYS